MDNHIEQSHTLFRKSGEGGKLEAPVKIIAQENISNKKSFGDILKTTVEINGRKREMIIKRYFFEGNAQRAFEQYGRAKAAGLKVFPTFRIGEDGKSILMTSGFSIDETCVGSNKLSGLNLQDLGLAPIEEFEEGILAEFLNDIFAHGIYAAQHGFVIEDDVLFFIISKDRPTKMDFVIGDLDCLHEVKLKKYTAMMNMRAIRRALVEFCENNMIPGLRAKFIEQVDEYQSRTIKEIENNDWDNG